MSVKKKTSGLSKVKEESRSECMPAKKSDPGYFILKTFAVLETVIRKST